MAYLTVNSITMVFIFTLFINEIFKSKTIYFLWCFGIFFCEVAMVILIVNKTIFLRKCVLKFQQLSFFFIKIQPIGFAKVFGERNLSLIYGLISVLSIPGTILTSVISPLIDIIGYFFLFCSACIFSAIAFVAALLFNVKSKDGKDVQN